MHLKLKSFSTIISGYAFRGAIEADWVSKTFVIQARNIYATENVRETKGLTPIKYEGARGLAFLQKGDILLVSRGAGKGSFRVSVYESENQNVLATSSLLIIRLFNGNILPGYLAHYLNSDEGQYKLLETVSGSYIQAISRLKLENLEIPIPPIEKQRILVSLAENIRKQQTINERQNQIKKNFVSAAFKNL